MFGILLLALSVASQYTQGSPTQDSTPTATRRKCKPKTTAYVVTTTQAPIAATTSCTKSLQHSVTITTRNAQKLAVPTKIVSAVHAVETAIVNAGHSISETLSQAVASLRQLVPSLVLPNTQDFQNDCLVAHNEYRKLVQLPPMVVDAALVASAQRVANNLAATDTFEHSHTPGQGENLYQNTNGDASAFTARTAISAWFNEFPLYKGEPIGQGAFEGYGHFTQVRVQLISVDLA